MHYMWAGVFVLEYVPKNNFLFVFVLVGKCG